MFGFACWHEDYQAEGFVVNFVPNHLLDAYAVLCFHIPEVALSINGLRTIVEEVVEHVVVAIVLKHVFAWVIVGSVLVFHLTSVHFWRTDDGHAPEVVLDKVALDVGCTLASRIVDADTATTVVGVGFVSVVNDVVVDDVGVHRAGNVDPVAVFLHHVVLDHHLVRESHAEHIAHSNTTHLGVVSTDNGVVRDFHIFSTVGGEVDLWTVRVLVVVGTEVAVGDFDADWGVGTVADSS